MKRIISLALATLLCAAVFVGCGSDPLSQVEKAEDVITYLEEQGLPIVYKIQYTSQNDPNGSGSHAYISRANFSDSTIEDTYDKEQPESGAVELFETAEEAEQRAKTLKEYQGANPLAYMILKDRVLLRMNTFADKEIIEKYAKALGTEIYSVPSEANKMLQAAPIKNGVFAVSPNDFANIINQYVQEYVQDESPISNMSKISAENKDFYTYNIDAYNKIRFITDETRNNTQAILIECDYLSDSSNGAKAGNYLSCIMMACDKKMNEDLGLQIIHDLNMFNMKETGSYFSAHNGVSYYLSVDNNKITILIQPESANQSTAASDISHTSTSQFSSTISSEIKSNSDTSSKTVEAKTETSTAPVVTTSQQNALKRAKQYLKTMPFSYTGLIEQLEYEKYSHEDAVYAADNCGADWNEQAAKKAKDYLDIMSFSRQGLIEQLEFEGYTHEQAVYGVNQTGL